VTGTENLSRDAFRLVVWYPVRWLVKVLPIRMGLSALRAMGMFQHRLSSGKKGHIAENMRAQLPQMTHADIDAAIREHFKNHFVNQLQLFFFSKLTTRNAEKIHTFEGLENLEAAKAEGKGCILIHPHFGPTQLPLQILGLLGEEPMQIGFLNDEGLSFVGRHVAFRLRAKLEAQIKGEIVQAGTYLKPLFKHLKNNGVLLTAGDGVGGGKMFIGRYTALPFLEGDYLFPLGGASLAGKTGAALLPMFTVLDGGRYKTIVEAPVHVENTPEGIEAAVAHFRDRFDQRLKEQPGLWHLWDEVEHKMVSEENGELVGVGSA